MTHNTAGIEYARLSDTKAGDTLVADDGFTCVATGPHVVEADEQGLFIHCKRGQHYLDGQCDDGDHIVGFVTEANAAEERRRDGTGAAP